MSIGFFVEYFKVFWSLPQHAEGALAGSGAGTIILANIGEVICVIEQVKLEN